ncbi:MAG: stage 0 sporulation family protein [Chloroflexota bacterium]|nr:stage 0 sporulation family protein [Chloroflexota bacterium]
MSDHQRTPVGVRFKEAGKIYYFDCGEAELDVGNYVVVETSHGLEVGRVVISPEQVLASEIKESLKPIVRVATAEDLEQRQRLKDLASQQLREAKHRVAEQNVDMQIVSGEYDLEGSQVTFYYTAADRVDFRGIVRDLSAEFGAKVQMLQVGERDRAKLLDGYDVCGQRLCCSSWQPVFPSVSIKMAKEQDLPLNPQKISGVCGRLYCCLTFEYEGYRELRGQLPKVGSMVSTPVGEAKVNSVNVLKKTVRLWLTEQKQVLEMPAVDLQMQYGLTVRPVELVREIEDPLRHETPVAPAEAPPLGMPERATQTSPGEAHAAQPSAASNDDGAGKRRRRGRRGGRQRRRDGGGDAGGQAPASGPPGPAPRPPGA